METIDVKDLVVGAYIACGDTIHQVAGVNSQNMIRIKLHDDKDLLVWVRNYSPIPITPEWLLRLGFEQVDSRYELNGQYDDDDEPHTLVSINWARTSHYFVFGDSSERVFDIPVKSVHHLQTLVWNLERIWLTIQKREGEA